MQPRSLTTEVAMRPRNADLLRQDMIAQFQLDQVSGSAHFRDGRPAERDHRQINPIVMENACPLKLAHVEAIDR
jgi:hypothetical protein